MEGISICNAAYALLLIFSGILLPGKKVSFAAAQHEIALKKSANFTHPFFVSAPPVLGFRALSVLVHSSRGQENFQQIRLVFPPRQRDRARPFSVLGVRVGARIEKQTLAIGMAAADRPQERGRAAMVLGVRTRTLGEKRMHERDVPFLDRLDQVVVEAVLADSGWSKPAIAAPSGERT